jgi:uncharacterized membrane protein YgaE (UPF0421/DUF939 family)
MTVLPTTRGRVATALRRRLRPSLPPILQTAAAAVAAWYLAVLLLPAESPSFASIACVICLGATYGQRPKRAIELIGGVLLGIVVAEILLHLIDRGPLQLGLLVVLAMSVAVMLRSGGELFVNEAAITAIILVSIDPSANGFTTDRIFEGLIGGGVALAVSSLLFPPHPVALVGDRAQHLFAGLAGALEELSEALDAADAVRAERSLAATRELDRDVAALRDALEVADDTARLALPRRGQRARIRPYVATMPQIDYAVRNARVLARHGLRYTRNRLPAPEGLPEAVRELADAVWALGAQYESPERSTQLRRLALSAAMRATEIFEREPDLAVTEIVGQVRSIAVDLLRAADELCVPGRDEAAARAELGLVPTEELLVPVAS